MRRLPKRSTLLSVFVACTGLAALGGSQALATQGGYWVWATQYVPNTSVPNQLAVPDKKVKACAVNKSCSTSYPSGRNYSVTFTPKNTSEVVTASVGEVGPWNVDDNYWDPDSNWPRTRRLFRDLAQGTPEAYAAVGSGYNGGYDQFGRFITSRPYGPGVDISTQLAGVLGWPSGYNDWIFVRSYNWDY